MKPGAFVFNPFDVTYVYATETVRFGRAVNSNGALITMRFDDGQGLWTEITTNCSDEGISWLRGSATPEQIAAARTARALSP